MCQSSRSAFPCNQLLLQQTGGILLIFDWGNGCRYDLRNLSDIAKRLPYRVFESCYAWLVNLGQWSYVEFCRRLLFQDIGLVALQYVH